MQSRRQRSRRHPVLVALTILLLGFVAWLLIRHEDSTIKDGKRQKALQPFYTPPDPLPPGKPGKLLRSAPLKIGLPYGGRAFRILYRSQRPNGSPTVSSGMAFVPANKPPPGGWPVVAWAHGTLGMGDACAPSRSKHPLNDMNWLGEMLQRGWLVVTTDYAGLGTPGVEYYLVGRNEAHDVLNSVRAARQLEPGKTSGRFALWGHSQGGHSVLFAASEAAAYAPELNLVAAAAAAPAAEIPALLTEQADNSVDWLIGSEVLVAWPSAYPGLQRQAVVSDSGLRKYKDVADHCISLTTLLAAILRSDLGDQFFKVNPVSVPSWYEVAKRETPPTLPAKIPLMITQGLSDTVVLPNTTALYVKRACQAGSNLFTMWMGDVNHPKTAIVSGPAVTSWLFDRFAGKPASSNCDQPLPLTPAHQPPQP